MSRVMLRTTDSAEFCHAGHESTLPTGKLGPADDWLQAEGQPREAIRFKVRPLSPSEYAAVCAIDSVLGQAAEACRVALLGVSQNGEAVGDLSLGAQQEVLSLVLGVTTAPFTGRMRMSTASAPAA